MNNLDDHDQILNNYKKEYWVIDIYPIYNLTKLVENHIYRLRFISLTLGIIAEDSWEFYTWSKCERQKIMIMKFLGYLTESSAQTQAICNFNSY